MKRSFFKTIKAKITVITVSFTLIITMLLAFVSFFIFESYAHKNLIQATEFNLQLVSGLIAQDISSLDVISQWCSNSTQIITYLSSEGENSIDALSTYKQLNEEFQSNRAKSYIQRLVIIDVKHTKMLQVGSAIIESNLVTLYNVDDLIQNLQGQATAWETIQPDYTYNWKSSSAPTIIPILRPVYQSGSREVIGYVYMAVSTKLITDRLSSYHLEPDSRLYLSLGKNNYQINGTSFNQLTADYFLQSSGESTATLDTNTQVNHVSLRGETSTVISYPIRNTNLSLSNSLSQQQLSQQKTLFMRLILLICISVLLLGFFITVLLNHFINTPVNRIRKRLDVISKGNFSNDPKIEWDNELGDIGKGINKLSLNVASLMDIRLANEKEKQDLEYQMLQSQINPHFLYNTLNSIKWMATIQGASGIAEMTTSFSRLLKSVSKGTQKIITLREELAFLDDYFLIQQYRYGGSITMTKYIADDVYDNMIPRFTLQPILENAIFHGIEPKGGAGKIQITARSLDADSVGISIQDDGIGMDEEKVQNIFNNEKPASGMFRQVGIRNVHKRIQYEFGDKYGLTITSKVGVFTKATILLPRRTCSAPGHIETTNNGIS